MLSENIETYKFILAKEEKDFQNAKTFRQYAKSLNFDLCFQNFENEIKNIQTQYNLPTGRLILVLDKNNRAIGCVGIRKFENKIAELKRMYLKKNYRNQNLGKKLLQLALDEAKNLGYKKIRLDTIATMEAAIHLYRKTGFKEIPSYRHNPIEDVKYFEYELGRNNRS